MPHTASYDLCSCLLLLLSRLARICSKLMSGRQPVGDSISGSSMRWAPGGGGGREHKVTGGGGRVGEGGPGSRRAVAGWQAGRWKAGRRKQAGGHRPPGRKVGRQAGGRAGRQAGRRTLNESDSEWFKTRFMASEKESVLACSKARAELPATPPAWGSIDSSARCRCCCRLADR